MDADTLATNAVTDVKISAMAASKLTGAMPALDGSALTGIAAGKTEVISSSHTGASGIAAIEIDLPKWTVQEAIDFRRWLLGFREGIVVESPEEFVDEIKLNILNLQDLYGIKK